MQGGDDDEDAKPKGIEIPAFTALNRLPTGTVVTSVCLSQVNDSVQCRSVCARLADADEMENIQQRYGYNYAANSIRAFLFLFVILDADRVRKLVLPEVEPLCARRLILHLRSS